MQTKTNSALSRPLVVMLLASLCCLLWGSAIPFINLGYRYFEIDGSDTATQILFGGCRFLMAGMLTILFESIAQKKIALPKKTSWGNVVKLSLAQTIIQYVFFYIGVAGIVVVNWTKDGFAGGMSFIGEGFVIVSMLASACSTGLIKKFGAHDSPVVMSGWQFMLGGAVMMIIGLLSGGRLRASNMLAYAVLFYLAMLSAVAYSIWAVLLRVNPVSRVAVYTFLQPIFGVFLSLTLVDRGSEAPLLRYAAALVLICVSIAVVNRGQRQEG